MIINTGMRTDIPAFYSEWFANRLKEGYVYVRNPFHPQSITKYILNEEVVDCIGFCTKNPSPMFRYMDLLKGYGQYWFVTITPYGKDIEPHVKDKHVLLDNFKQLSNIVGKDNIGLRYDPIFLTEKYNVDYHLRAFETIVSSLEGYTHTCVISFIDLYAKVVKNFPEVKEVTVEEQLYLGKQMIQIAQKYGMVLKPCAEGNLLKPYGADTDGCMTKEVYEKAVGCRMKFPSISDNRSTCHCYITADIGAYNSCMHLCRYCYANYSKALVQQNYARHDPTSPILIGHVHEGDTIHTAKQQSWKQRQLSLF